jgi:hypothetical protein
MDAPSDRAHRFEDYNAFPAGDRPVILPSLDVPIAEELAAIAQEGGASAWLADEPDLYSLDDGEPV